MTRLELLLSREWWIEQIESALYEQGIKLKRAHKLAVKTVNDQFMNYIKEIPEEALSQDCDIVNIRKVLKTLYRVNIYENT